MRHGPDHSAVDRICLAANPARLSDAQPLRRRGRSIFNGTARVSDRRKIPSALIDASTNQPPFTWNASTGNVTVTIGAASPIVVGTVTQNSYNGLAITKNGTAFSMALNGSTVFTTTATIAAIANLLWPDNTGTGTLLQQANLTTLDVYESQSIVTGAALQALLAAQNAIYSYDAIRTWTVP